MAALLPRKTARLILKFHLQRIFNVPNPNRARISYAISEGFCRADIQKVMRKWHGKGVQAQHCIEMFSIVQGVTGGSIYGGKDPKGKRRQWIGQIVRHYPDFFAELTLAVKNSDLPAGRIDRVIEENFLSLHDRVTNKKLSEALPKLNEEQLDRARDRISKLNKIAKFWFKKAIEVN